jgi:hypothetical protein
VKVERIEVTREKTRLDQFLSVFRHRDPLQASLSTQRRYWPNAAEPITGMNRGQAAIGSRPQPSAHRSRASALSCHRRSSKYDTADSAKKITTPTADSRISAANIRGMSKR